MPNPLPEQLQIGDWQVRPLEGVIQHGDEVVDIRPRAMDVLVFLASKPGKIVSNDELVEAVWAPARVSDDAVMGVISELRKALQDDHRSYIVRVPKRGYQLIATVGPFSNAGLPPPASIRARKLGVFAVAGLIAALAIAYLVSTDAKTEQVILAVLPFVDLRGEDEAMARGISDDIVRSLSGLPNVKVLARGATAPYAQPESDLAGLVEDLNATHALEGTYRRVGRNFTLDVQLVDLKESTTMLADQFTDDYERLFGVKQAFSREIAQRLSGSLEAALIKGPELSTPAYEALLRAWAADEMADRRLAILEARQSIGLDPNNPYAHRKLAAVYATGNVELRADWLDVALKHNEKALQLYPNYPDALYLQARLDHLRYRDHARTFQQFTELARRFPNHLGVWYVSNLYESAGRYRDQVTVLEHVVSMNPNDLVAATVLIGAHLANGDLANARVAQARVWARAPDNPWVLNWSFWVAFQENKIDEAKALRQKLESVLKERQSWYRTIYDCALAWERDDKARALEIAREVRADPTAWCSYKRFCAVTANDVDGLTEIARSPCGPIVHPQQAFSLRLPDPRWETVVNHPDYPKWVADNEAKFDNVAWLPAEQLLGLDP